MNKIKQNLNIVLIAVSLVLLVFSLTFPRQTGDVAKEAKRVEKILDKRLKLLDSNIDRLLNLSSEDMFCDDDTPSDFVLYRYENERLVSWFGQLPVQRDEYIGRGSRSILSKVGYNYKFFVLADSPFLLKKEKKGDVIIIAGMPLKDNKHLKIDDSYSFKTMESYDGVAVSVMGKPSFRLVCDTFVSKSPVPAQMVWISYILFALAMLLSLSSKPTLKNAAALIALLFFLAVVAYRNYSVLQGELTQIMSILFVSMLATVIVSALYVARRDLWKKSDKKIYVIIGAISVFLSVAFLLWFAFISIFKVLTYTHICLDLNKIWAINLNTLIVYVALFADFFAIAELLSLLQPLFVRLFRKRLSIFSKLGVFIYSVFVSAFCLGNIAYIGFQREKTIMSSWAETLANARDYGLESHLRAIERQLSTDSHISGTDEESLSRSRGYIMEKYFSKYLNNYDIFLLPGRASGAVGIEDGVRIESGSQFRYAPLPDQRSRYVAAFHYYHIEKGQETLFLILEPKYPDKRSLSMILESRLGADIPGNYSYALYKEGDRQYMKGSFPYPIKLTSKINDDFRKKGEYSFRKFGYTNFVIPVKEGEFFVISRPNVIPGTFFISFVFITLMFYFIMSLMIIRRRKPLFFVKNYFKRKMTLLLVAALFLTMSTLAFVSVSFVYDRNTMISNRMMSDKVNSIRFQLQSGMRGVKSAKQLNSPEVMALLRKTGDDTGSDISLYRTDGKLVMSTAPDLYEKHVMDYRMPSVPFHHLRYRNEGFCIQRQDFGDRSISMLYAPIMGLGGEVIAFFSSPYIENGRNFQFDAILHAFNVIVVFILLLLISSLAASSVVDRTFKPLSEMSRKMRSGRIEKLTGINSRKDDEITDIIDSYNRMVDDLSKSAQVMARAERDKAWSEMARNVAHEIKNPLTPMQLQIQRVQRLKANGDPTWQDKFDVMCKVLLDHINVLTETANQFSDFAKLYSEEPVRIALDDMLREEVALYSGRQDIEFSYIGLAGAEINGPRPQLVRVFVNLLNNAIQACENKPHPCVEVFLRNGTAPDYYEIVFEDNGDGVEDANIDKLFTPKFTTKSSGSGLGLSICRSILEQCGAIISYSRSFRLGGACFTILYPKIKS